MHHKLTTSLYSIHATPRGPSEQQRSYRDTMAQAQRLLTLLQELCDMGSAMRTVMTRCLVSPAHYQLLLQPTTSCDAEHASFMQRSTARYSEALASLPSPKPPPEFSSFPSLTSELSHHTFLEELVFWTFLYEFPEKLAGLLLTLLPASQHQDLVTNNLVSAARYKEALTRAFVQHYSRMSIILVKSNSEWTIGWTRMSCNLTADQDLMLRMTEEHHFLHILVFTLRSVLSNALETVGEPHSSRHEVVNLAEVIMKEHNYWPIVSDFCTGILSRPPIARRFLEDETLLKIWFEIVFKFQGMNVNVREEDIQKQKDDPQITADTVSAFSVELDQMATPMWWLVLQFSDGYIQEARNVISLCLSAIRNWFREINFLRPDQVDMLKVSFHLPLHRYFSVFVRQVNIWLFSS